MYFSDHQPPLLWYVFESLYGVQRMHTHKTCEGCGCALMSLVDADYGGVEADGILDPESKMRPDLGEELTMIFW